MPNYQHILYIAYTYQPSPYVGARRHAGICHALASQVDKLSLWTGNPHPAISFPVYSLRRLRHWDLPKLIKPSTGVSPAQHGPKPIISFLIKLKNSIPFSIFFGLGGPCYVLQAYWLFCRLPEPEKPDTIFTSFFPLADLLAGYLIKRSHPQVQWIADFRDLPVDRTKNQVLWPSITNWFFKRLLHKADQVTTVSSGIADHLPVTRSKIYVFNNGFDQEKLSDHSGFRSKKFTITYTGSVHKGLQNPTPLFSSLQKLIMLGKLDAKDIEFQYAGPQSNLWYKWLSIYPEINLVDLGYLTKDQAIKIQQHSQINLLLTWSTEDSSGILTSKLYDYLAARRPILAIVNGLEDSELDHLIIKTNGGFCHYTLGSQQDQLQTWLLDKYEEWSLTQTTSDHSNIELLTNYSWENLCKKWLADLQVKE